MAGITKKILFATVVLLMVVALAGCAGPDSKKTIKIGLGLALTGGSAEQGNRARRGVLLAIEEANKAGGYKGRMFEYVPLDDRADPKESANVANKLVADPEVIAVVGHTNSSCTLAAAPIYNKGGLVHITTSSSSPAISTAGAYTFRVWNSDVHTASFNVKKIISLGYKNIAIIYENNDYGRGGYNVALKTLEEAGMKPVAEESFLLGETKDFSAIITKLKSAGADAIYGVADETEIPLFLKQSHLVGYNPFFVSSGTYNPAVLRLGGVDVEGAVGNSLYNPDNMPPALKAFFDKFIERFKSEGVTVAEPTSAVSYEAARMIIEAVKKNGSTREGVKNYLTTLKDFDSVVGKLSFDVNGDVFIPMVHMTIKDGKFTEFKR